VGHVGVMRIWLHVAGRQRAWVKPRAQLAYLARDSCAMKAIGLDMMSDQFPQAKTVDPNEVIDTSFIKRVESTISR